jgi:DNA-binding MarR family transcriptional regulator
MELLWIAPCSLSRSTGVIPLISTSKSPARFGARSPRAKRNRASVSLPPKDLAAVLAVNTYTVLRALRVLHEEGLLEFRRGRGISVAGTLERGAVIARAKELVDFARR